MSEYSVMIRGESAEDDGLSIDMGEIRLGRPWWNISLPTCPDCGGDLVWYEAGHVPGTRKCMGQPINERGSYHEHGGCGSIFNIQTRHGHIVLRRERFY